MKVIVDSALQGVVRLGVLRLADITLPQDGGDALWQSLVGLCEVLENKWRGLTVGQIPEVLRARLLYRSIGIDPTKTRPSSEALLRRLLKGKTLYRIHPLVDLFNMVSLQMLTPVGLYDESKIAGDTVIVRLGREEESYEGIRKDRVNVGNRFCLADQKGPFGSPTSDSLRTSVEGTVTKALAVFFQHASLNDEVLKSCLDLSIELSKKHLGANETLSVLISC